MTRSGAGGDSDQPGHRAGLCICGPRVASGFGEIIGGATRQGRSDYAALRG